MSESDIRRTESWDHVFAKNADPAAKAWFTLRRPDGRSCTFIFHMWPADRRYEADAFQETFSITNTAFIMQSQNPVVASGGPR